LSYCVNCGVELEDSEPKCPLCGVTVMNPAQENNDIIERKYPKRIETIESAIDRQFWVKIISIFLAVPILVCLLCNLLYDGKISWSVYPIGGIAVLWAFCISPFLFKKPATIKWIIIDIVAASLYLYLIQYITQSGGWFIPVALPIVLGVGFFVLLITVLIQHKKLKGLYIHSAIFFAIGILLIGVEILIDLYQTKGIYIIWSWFVLISCVAIAFTFIFIERKKKLKEELKRRLHI